MSQRRELEDRYTVRCQKCSFEIVDPSKRPRQKFIIGRCPSCGFIRLDSHGRLVETQGNLTTHSGLLVRHWAEQKKGP